MIKRYKFAPLDSAYTRHLKALGIAEKLELFDLKFRNPLDSTVDSATLYQALNTLGYKWNSQTENWEFTN